MESPVVLSVRAIKALVACLEQEDFGDDTSVCLTRNWSDLGELVQASIEIEDSVGTIEFKYILTKMGVLEYQ